MWLNLAFFLLYLGQTKLLIPPYMSDTLSQLQILIPTLSEFHQYEDIPNKRHLFEKKLLVNCRTRQRLYISVTLNTGNRHPVCDCLTVLNWTGDLNSVPLPTPLTLLKKEGNIFSCSNQSFIISLSSVLYLENRCSTYTCTEVHKLTVVVVHSVASIPSEL